MKNIIYFLPLIFLIACSSDENNPTTGNMGKWVIPDCFMVSETTEYYGNVWTTLYETDDEGRIIKLKHSEDPPEYIYKYEYYSNYIQLYYSYLENGLDNFIADEKWIKDSKGFITKRTSNVGYVYALFGNNGNQYTYAVSIDGGSSKDSSVLEFKNGNVIKVHHYSYYNGNYSKSGVAYYTYDSKINPYYLQIPFFGASEERLPLTFSKSNPLTRNYICEGCTTDDFCYYDYDSYNSNGFPLTVPRSGCDSELYASLTYSCQ